MVALLSIVNAPFFAGPGMPRASIGTVPAPNAAPVWGTPAAGFGTTFPLRVWHEPSHEGPASERGAR